MYVLVVPVFIDSFSHSFTHTRFCKYPQARGFDTRDDVQDFLFNNPDYMVAAVHFVFDPLSIDLADDPQGAFQQLLPPDLDAPPNLNGENPPPPADISLVAPPAFK